MRVKDLDGEGLAQDRLSGAINASHRAHANARFELVAVLDDQADVGISVPGLDAGEIRRAVRTKAWRLEDPLLACGTDFVRKLFQANRQLDVRRSIARPSIRHFTF